MIHIRTRWLVIAAIVPLFLASLTVVVDLKTGLRYIAIYVAGIVLAVIGTGTICLLSMRCCQGAFHSWRAGKAVRGGLSLLGGIVLLFFTIVVAVVTAIGVLDHGQRRANAFAAHGEAWLRQGEFDKAIADSTESIRLDPKLAVAFNNRGFAWFRKRQVDRAFADYNEAIRLDPKHAMAFSNRGLAWAGMGKLDKAIADYDEAIRIDPKLALAFSNRRLAWLQKGERDRAIADYDEAIRLAPNYAMAFSNRGLAWLQRAEPDKAIADFDEAIRLDSKLAAAFNNRAWLRATWPDQRYRDGKKAVQDGTKACELHAWKDPANLAVLAAAYAEVGDFPSAIKWQLKAIELVPEKSSGDLRSRLVLYQSHKPYREQMKK